MDKLYGNNPNWYKIMENLKVSLIQTELTWENAEVNRAHFDRKIADIKETDLIILPEMFTTGFSMQPKHLAELPEGPTLLWMQHWAKLKNAVIIGSLIVTENDKYFNRLYVVFPDGKSLHYDKRHLFSFAGEDHAYSAGIEKLVFTYKSWKICPLVCYDLRFPVWARNTEVYDVLLYVANWPAVRISSWDILLRGRSVENICYTIGLNRIGTDPNGNTYNGHSAVYSPLGNKLSQNDWESDFVETLQLSAEELCKTRQQFPFLDDRDQFDLTV